jgi:hypothetical protein
MKLKYKVLREWNLSRSEHDHISLDEAFYVDLKKL